MFVDTIQSLSDELARRGYQDITCVADTEQTEVVATLALPPLPMAWCLPGSITR